jgi:hypothetical protein
MPETAKNETRQGLRRNTSHRYPPYRMKAFPVRVLFAVCLGCLFQRAVSQPVQRITGTVVDKTTQQPLPGATIFITLTSPDGSTIGTMSDPEGHFVLEKVPVGRHTLNSTFIGYEPWSSPYLELTSGKQLVVTIELIPSSTLMQEVVVHNQRNPNEASNEFDLVSGRSFTAEETQRYAGSINDPGRMALSLPGTQISNEDNENTIVVRSNSPIGLSWRLEGIEIPNPNHFAEVGSSGGGISALSIYMLGTSDFFTGAFPAEFGNATAGIMDLKFRKGNRENLEFRCQAGLIGLDFASEGPITEGKKSSYLFNYRYSTLGLLSSMGVHVVNPLTNNTFQDVSFNLNFPIGKKTTVTFFGLGGTSNEIKSYVTDSSKWTTYDAVSPYNFYSRMGVTGLTYTHLVDEKSYLYGVVSAGASYIEEHDDTVGTQLKKTSILNEHHLTGRITTAWSYNRNLGVRSVLKTGFQASSLFYDVFREDYDNTLRGLRLELKGKNQTTLVQPYAVVRTRVSSRVTLQGGINTMYFDYTKEFLVEPRGGAQIKIGSGTLSLAYGQHSQILPFQTYEAVTTDSLTGKIRGKPNQHLKMWRARHYGLSFNQPLPGNIRLKIEPYYQYLFHVPVSIHPWNTYSLINQDRNFMADSLSNKGTGYNTGIELTFEKAFSNHFFFLLSASLYDSKYKTNNGGVNRSYNTKYNSGFNSALTFGKEWDLNGSKRLEVGGRVLWSEGQRYTPYNTAASIEKGQPVLLYNKTYADRIQNYFRIDTRIALRKNAKKLSWKLSLDIQNVTNYKNPQRPYFDRWTGRTSYQYNTSIIPVISYMVDF